MTALGVLDLILGMGAVAVLGVSIMVLLLIWSVRRG